MSKPFYFLAVYKTNFVGKGQARLVFDLTKIEFLFKSKTYLIPVQLAHKFPQKRGRVIVKAQELRLEDNQVYVEITTQTLLNDPNQALIECEKNIDSATTLLSTIYGPYFLDSLTYRGWLIKDDWGILYSWIQPADQDKLNISEKKLFATFSTAREKLSEDSDILRRFSMMAKFFVKSLSYNMSEEKFLLLWTILEIFPMKNTSNIRPISEYLSKITGIDTSIIKDKLEIGKLYGIRSSLVHDGVFRVDVEVLENHYDDVSKVGHFHYKSELLGKLENIVHEVLRSMCGLPYSGSLDKYLK
jgi:Apea-like HEPN